MISVILSHEYPPSGRGGISEHVRRLATSLGEIRPLMFVHVIANDPQMRGEVRDGWSTIHKVSPWIGGNNFLNWALLLNTEFVREASSLNRTSRISILHAHDWMTVPAAVTMKIAHDVPFVLTVHSTESRRCNGIHSEYSQAIESIEVQGIREAALVIVNNEETRDNIRSEFETPPEKIRTAPPEERYWARDVSSIYLEAVDEAGHR